jgi:hypothetical protein
VNCTFGGVAARREALTTTDKPPPTSRSARINRLLISSSIEQASRGGILANHTPAARENQPDLQ